MKMGLVFDDYIEYINQYIYLFHIQYWNVWTSFVYKKENELEFCNGAIELEKIILF